MLLFYSISVSAEIMKLFWILECAVRSFDLSELDSELCKMLIEIFVTFLVTAERVIFDKV